MADTKQAVKSESIRDLLGSLERTEKSTLSAMHRIAGSFNGAFPDVGTEGSGPRQRIIDAAFGLTGEMVDAGHRMVKNVVEVAEDAVRDLA